MNVANNKKESLIWDPHLSEGESKLGDSISHSFPWMQCEQRPTPSLQLMNCAFRL